MLLTDKNSVPKRRWLLFALVCSMAIWSCGEPEAEETGDEIFGSAPTTANNGEALCGKVCPGQPELCSGSGPAQDIRATLTSATNSPGKGALVHAAGDMDGDGVGDLIYSERWTNVPPMAIADPVTMPRHGMVRLKSGATGKTLRHYPNYGIGWGSGIATIADRTGDGFREVVVSSYARTWVLNGKNGNMLAALGHPGKRFGPSLAAAGDYLVTGAPMYLNNRGYVTISKFKPAATNNHSPVLVDEHVGAANQRLGAQVGHVGDVDGDGSPDFAFGTAVAEGGKGTLTIWSAAGRKALFTLTGTSVGCGLGTGGIAPLGDIDGDELSDFLVGEPGYDGSRGRVHVVNGGTKAIQSTVTGIVAGGHFGRAVAGVGDVNGDGKLDFLVGAPGGGKGAAYLISGAAGHPTLASWHGVAPASNLGYSVAAIGDTNGDGRSEFAFVGHEQVVKGRWKCDGNSLVWVGEWQGDAAPVSAVDCTTKDMVCKPIGGTDTCAPANLVSATCLGAAGQPAPSGNRLRQVWKEGGGTKTTEIDCSASGQTCQSGAGGPVCEDGSATAAAASNGALSVRPVAWIRLYKKGCKAGDVCNGRGACAGSTGCTCDTGWSGTCCETPVGGATCVADQDCGANGTCSANKTCVCKPGFAGEACEKTLTCAPGLFGKGCAGKCPNNVEAACDSRGLGPIAHKDWAKPNKTFTYKKAVDSGQMLSAPGGRAVVGGGDFDADGVPDYAVGRPDLRANYAALGKACGAQADCQGPGEAKGVLSCDKTPATKTICGYVTTEEAELKLQCPPGSMIGEVLYASYGTPKVTAATFAQTCSGGYSACHEAKTAQLVRESCHGKSACTLKPSAIRLKSSDPCSGTYKQLAVTVQCVPAFETVCAAADEAQKLELACPAGSVFSGVHIANYGNQKLNLSTYASTCAVEANATCRAKAGVEKVSAACIGKEKCTLTASPSFFGEDPCENIKKTLQVVAECSPSLTTRTCGSAGDFKTLKLKCEEGAVMEEVIFASYGTPTLSGTGDGEICEGAVSTCASSGDHARKAVETACLGKSACSVYVDYKKLGGDPCSNIAKNLSAVVRCSAPTICTNVGGTEGGVDLRSGKDGRLLRTLRGRPGDAMGGSLAVIGDVDGDLRDDIVVGAPEASPGGAIGRGAVLLFSGATGKLLRAIDGESNLGEFGRAVAGGGDVDGDSYPDFFVGSPGWSSVSGGAAAVTTGEARGRVQGFSGRTGKLLWTVTGALDGARLGSSLAVVPDANGDGRPDLVAGAPMADITIAGKLLAAAGRVHLLRGDSGAAIKLSLPLRGKVAKDRFGAAVATLRGPSGSVGFAVGAPGPAERVTLYSVGPPAGTPVPNAPVASVCDVPANCAGLNTPSKDPQNGSPCGKSCFANAFKGPAALATFGCATKAEMCRCDRWAQHQEAGIYSCKCKYGRCDSSCPCAKGSKCVDGWCRPGIDVEWLLEIKGPGGETLFGSAVAGPGDLDGDGVGDLVVGAPGQNGAAGARVGRIAAFSGKDGKQLFETEGRQLGGGFGGAVSAAGVLIHGGRPAVVGGGSGGSLDADHDLVDDWADTDDDGDGIVDKNDNCPVHANAKQLDTDGDGVGDVCQNAAAPGRTDIVQYVAGCVAAATCGSGTCADGPSGAGTCSCVPGFSGDKCQVNTNDCTASSCGGHGTCVDLVNGFRCLCDHGYYGDKCDKTCPGGSAKPCNGHGTCGSADGACYCDSEWAGAACEVEAEFCAAKPCRNGGKCSEIPGPGFACDCPSGWSGPTCEKQCPHNLLPEPNAKPIKSPGGFIFNQKVPVAVALYGQHPDPKSNLGVKPRLFVQLADGTVNTLWSGPWSEKGKVVSAAGVGDLNGDGATDLVVGMPSEGAPRTCGSAGDFKTLTLQCAAGAVIEEVIFASYGTPTLTGTGAGEVCEGAVSTCASSGDHARKAVETVCLGKSTCSVYVDYKKLGGDPCKNVPKHLAAVVRCSNGKGRMAAYSHGGNKLWDVKGGKAKVGNFTQLVPVRLGQVSGVATLVDGNLVVYDNKGVAAASVPCLDDRLSGPADWAEEGSDALVTWDTKGAKLHTFSLWQQGAKWKLKPTGEKSLPPGVVRVLSLSDWNSDGHGDVAVVTNNAAKVLFGPSLVLEQKLTFKAGVDAVQWARAFVMDDVDCDGNSELGFPVKKGEWHGFFLLTGVGKPTKGLTSIDGMPVTGTGWYKPSTEITVGPVLGRRSLGGRQFIGFVHKRVVSHNNTVNWYVEVAETRQCTQQLCSGHGACDEKTNGTCSCQKGFKGNVCETNIDDCVGIDCSGNGYCVDGIVDHTCACNEGFFGLDCEYPIDKCLGPTARTKPLAAQGYLGFRNSVPALVAAFPKFGPGMYGGPPWTWLSPSAVKPAVPASALTAAPKVELIAVRPDPALGGVCLRAVDLYLDKKPASDAAQVVVLDVSACPSYPYSKEPCGFHSLCDSGVLNPEAINCSKAKVVKTIPMTLSSAKATQRVSLATEGVSPCLYVAPGQVVGVSARPGKSLSLSWLTQKPLIDHKYFPHHFPRIPLFNAGSLPASMPAGTTLPLKRAYTATKVNDHSNKYVMRRAPFNLLWNPAATPNPANTPASYTPCNYGSLCQGVGGGSTSCACTAGAYGDGCAQSCPGAVWNADGGTLANVCGGGGKCASGEKGTGECTCNEGYLASPSCTSGRDLCDPHDYSAWVTKHEQNKEPKFVPSPQVAINSLYIPKKPTAAGTASAGCVPKCEGRNCGGDQCGGSCGTCPSNQVCDGSQCVLGMTKPTFVTSASQPVAPATETILCKQHTKTDKVTFNCPAGSAIDRVLYSAIVPHPSPFKNWLGDCSDEKFANPNTNYMAEIEKLCTGKTSCTVDPKKLVSSPCTQTDCGMRTALRCVPTKQLCAVGSDWETINLSCPNGTVINRIEAAHWGTYTSLNTSTCEFVEGACGPSPTAASKVGKLCLGKTNCSVHVHANVLGTDPCSGVAKKMVVRARCGPIRSWDHRYSAASCLGGIQAKTYNDPTWTTRHALGTEEFWTFERELLIDGKDRDTASNGTKLNQISKGYHIGVRNPAQQAGGIYVFVRGVPSPVCIGPQQLDYMCQPYKSGWGVEVNLKESGAVVQKCAGDLVTAPPANGAPGINKSVELKCDIGKISAINWATYGRNKTYGGHCTPSNFYQCTKDAAQWVKEQCVGKASCTLKNINTGIGDPCGYQYHKYLGVNFTCAEDAAENICNLANSPALQCRFVGGFDRKKYNKTTEKDELDETGEYEVNPKLTLPCIYEAKTGKYRCKQRFYVVVDGVTVGAPVKKKYDFYVTEDDCVPQCPVGGVACGDNGCGGQCGGECQENPKWKTDSAFIDRYGEFCDNSVYMCAMKGDRCRYALTLTENMAVAGDTKPVFDNFSFKVGQCRGEMLSSYGSGGQDLVYAFKPKQTGWYQSLLSKVDAGFNPVLYLTSHCPDSGGGAKGLKDDVGPSCKGAANKQGAGQPEAIVNWLDANSTYYIVVDSADNSSGKFTLQSWLCSTDPNEKEQTACANGGGGS